jgi:hypothetical protein
MVRPTAYYWIYTGDDWELKNYKEIAEFTGYTEGSVKNKNFKDEWLVPEDAGKPTETPKYMISDKRKILVSQHQQGKHPIDNHDQHIELVKTLMLKLNISIKDL